MSMTTDLNGRNALVTGGSRGIGAAIVRSLAKAGAAVAINYRESAD
jgi:3-oxoacyl-[acyl-carrier protein] reductase